MNIQKLIKSAAAQLEFAAAAVMMPGTDTADDIADTRSSDAVTICGKTVYHLTLPKKIPYEGSAWQQLKQQLEAFPAPVLLICEQKNISTASRMLWESENLTGYVLTDTADPYVPENLVTKKDRLLWDIQAQQANENDQAFMSGWNNSYNNEAFTADELKEYVNDSRLKLAPYLNDTADVLEIGVGSGMIAFALAPLCHTYDGCDISALVLKQLEKMSAQKGIRNMSLFNLGADEAPLTGRLYDVILMSSVTEYFSGYNYMRLVVSNCIQALKEHGRLFFADVFDLNLKENYRASVMAYAGQHPSCRHKKDFSHELFIPRSFWHNLAASIPEIRDVQVTDKIGDIDNEINRFRYDVLLEIDKTQTECILPKPYKYQLSGENDTVTAL